MLRQTLLITTALSLVACSGDDAPDARIRLAPLPPDGATGSADARADGPSATAADASVATADAPVATADAPIATQPDAPVSGEPDAAVSMPDAAPVGPAIVIFNEISSDFQDQHDLVELLVTTAGTLDGIKLEKNFPHAPTVLATLPAVTVAVGELVVVHLTPAGTTAMTETTSKTEFLTADNYPGAWDVAGEEIDIPYSNVVLALRAKSGTVTTAVPFFRSDLVEPDHQPRDFPVDLQAIVTQGLWTDHCTPEPCTYSSNLGTVTVDWSGVGTTADPSSVAGASVARKTGAPDAHRASDWKPVNTGSTSPHNTYGTAN